MSSKHLSPLAKGSIVDIVAPGSATSRKDLLKALKFVRSLGLKPRVSAKIFGNTKLTSNTDEERFCQLKNALLAKDSSAVWCIRGGYGSIRLLPRLARLKRPKKFKPLLGYSDITTLHMFLNSVWKWPTVHSPMVGRFGRGEATHIELREIRKILFATEAVFEHTLTPLNSSARRKRKIRGAIVGGNMATIQSSLGTPWSLAAKGKIVFFEDIDERPHRVDRMLTQMEHAGFFKDVRAVIFGDFTLDSSRLRRLIWSDVIPRFAKDKKFPVLKGLQAGHGRVQRPIPFLTRSELDLGKAKPKLSVSLRVE